MGHFSVVLAADTYASVYPEGAAAAAAMVAGARARGLELTGPERSVGSVHKERAGTAGHEDMTVHLGREKNRGGLTAGRRMCGTGLDRRLCCLMWLVRWASRYLVIGNARSSRG